MRIDRLFILTGLCAAAFPAATLAQAPPAPVHPPAQSATPRPPAISGDCSAQTRESTQQNGPGTTTGQSREPLADRLAKSDGVLCPPNVDPEMRAPTPKTGTMPVIPPPGSPGGDPTVRPK